KLITVFVYYSLICLRIFWNFPWEFFLLLCASALYVLVFDRFSRFLRIVFAVIAVFLFEYIIMIMSPGYLPLYRDNINFIYFIALLLPFVFFSVRSSFANNLSIPFVFSSSNFVIAGYFLFMQMNRGFFICVIASLILSLISVVVNRQVFRIIFVNMLSLVIPSVLMLFKMEAVLAYYLLFGTYILLTCLFIIFESSVLVFLYEYRLFIVMLLASVLFIPYNFYFSIVVLVLLVAASFRQEQVKDITNSIYNYYRKKGRARISEAASVFSENMTGRVSAVLSVRPDFTFAGNYYLALKQLLSTPGFYTLFSIVAVVCVVIVLKLMAAGV
ncbi:MAG: hypothetical protein JXA66_07810, partial [Oligoflexia bacterium]|nr:hypothetical protein [Oligoflexia bacterium]